MKENPYNELGEKLDKMISKEESILSTLRLIAFLFCAILLLLWSIGNDKRIKNTTPSTTNEVQTTTESEVIK